MVKIFLALSSWQKFFIRTIIVVSLILFFYFFVASSVLITTDNMNPNLKKGDIVLGWHFGYGLPLPFLGDQKLKSVFLSRGDVISFWFPGDKEQLIIRRVVALPGDRLEIRKGLLFLNGKIVDYKSSHENQNLEKFQEEKGFHLIQHNPEMNLEFLVPENHVFVLSDLRKSRDDSTTWGAVPFKNIENHLGLIWFSMDEKKNSDWSRFFLWVK